MCNILGRVGNPCCEGSMCVDKWCILEEDAADATADEAAEGEIERTRGRIERTRAAITAAPAYYYYK